MGFLDVVRLVLLVASIHQATSFSPISRIPQRPTTSLCGKKKSKRQGKTAPQEKKSVQDARFDAMTQKFMFTMVGLTKILPDKSKTILDDIHLSFYPGAKIGVVGLNGSG